MRRKMFIGVRLRTLREEKGVTQGALARALGISASYLNQIEQNHRPLTRQVQARLSALWGIELLPDDDDARLFDDLRAVLTEQGADLPPRQLREIATDMPAVARAIIGMQKRLHEATVRADLLAGRMSGTSSTIPEAHEEVRDYLVDRNNHVGELDRAAEDLAARLGPLSDGLPRHLQDRHGIVLTTSRTALRAYDGKSALALSAKLRPGQRLFQMAAQLAFMEHGGTIDAIANAAALSPEGGRLLRIGLANYFAGALILPYTAFLTAAEELGYDIDLLAARFAVGYETVCHRLSTLQRKDAVGVPFFFVRVDRAGNISKRQSAANFHFSRLGGTCPLWNVYEAFSRPGEILTQMTQMPDGRRHLWIARTVAHRQGGHGTPAKTYAVAIGCDIRHAHRLTYARGIDLGNEAAATPIGSGCKVCERPACPQRAFPMLGRPLETDPTRARFAPYGTD